MDKKKRNTCNRRRAFCNGGMVAGFLLLFVALEVGIVAGKAAAENAGAIACGAAAGLSAADAAGAASMGGGLLAGLNWLLPRMGAALLAGGFLCKLLFWRCPQCGCHLTLCVRGDGRECPCCGAPLMEGEEDFLPGGTRP